MFFANVHYLLPIVNVTMSLKVRSIQEFQVFMKQKCFAHSLLASPSIWCRLFFFALLFHWQTQVQTNQDAWTCHRKCEQFPLLTRYTKFIIGINGLITKIVRNKIYRFKYGNLVQIHHAIPLSVEHKGELTKFSFSMTNLTEKSVHPLSLFISHHIDV